MKLIRALCVLGAWTISAASPPGLLDLSLEPGTGANNSIFSLALQANGKIIVGGSFTNYNGVPRTGIARLNVDGSLDRSFDPGLGALGVPGFVNAVRVQNDGKVLLAGRFDRVNGVARTNVARLNSDGSVDGTFDPGLGPDTAVSKLALQADGKLLTPKRNWMETSIRWRSRRTGGSWWAVGSALSMDYRAPLWLACSRMENWIRVWICA